MLIVECPECWQAKPIGTTYHIWTYLPKGHNQMYWTSTASEAPTSYLQSNTMDKTPQTQQRTLVEAVSTCWTHVANWQHRSFKPPHGFGQLVIS